MKGSKWVKDIALGGIPNKVRVGDIGADGRIFPVFSGATPRKQREGEPGLKECRYPRGEETGEGERQSNLQCRRRDIF